VLVDSSDKRSRVVKAAAELSYAHGLGNVTLADIADRAGVSLGNLYYYFRTKAAITEAIFAQRCPFFANFG
jgi:AcrR family transcriptional regulator